MTIHNFFSDDRYKINTLFIQVIFYRQIFENDNYIVGFCIVKNQSNEERKTILEELS